MRSCIELKQALQAGLCDSSLEKLYAPDGNTAALNGARSRALHVADQLMETFHPAQSEPAALFSGPGRTEIGGNHTDHQHGHVVVFDLLLHDLHDAAKRVLPALFLLAGRDGRRRALRAGGHAEGAGGGRAGLFHPAGDGAGREDARIRAAGRDGRRPRQSALWG